MVPDSLVLSSLDAARHVRAPRFFPAPASALDGQRRDVVVQADAAGHRLLARLLVPAPLPVLDLACFAAVERLLAAPALLPVLAVVYRARALLPARRARAWRAPLLSAGAIDIVATCCSTGRGSSGAGCGAERVVCTLTNRALCGAGACHRRRPCGNAAAIGIIASGRCCGARDAPALANGLLLLRPRESTGVLVAAATDAPHGGSLLP